MPIIKVANITNALSNEILKSIDTKGIKIIIGRHVKIQDETIFKKRMSSIEESEVRYISITPLLKSSLKKLFDVSIVVSMVVIQIIPGMILSNNFFSGPKTKGNIEIIKKKKISGRNILFKFLKKKIRKISLNPKI